jgi:hypothetical protein
MAIQNPLGPRKQGPFEIGTSFRHAIKHIFEGQEGEGSQKMVDIISSKEVRITSRPVKFGSFHRKRDSLPDSEGFPLAAITLAVTHERNHVVSISLPAYRALSS